MKKIALTLAALAALSTSSFAGDSGETAFERMQRLSYANDHGRH